MTDLPPSYESIIIPKPEPSIILNERQQEIYDLMLKGKNIFITGPAGCGKSELIKKFYKENWYRSKIGLTSTTGISALLIGGSTLHSFLGIFLGTDTGENLVKKIYPNKRKTWKELNTLIIDEVSMLDPALLDKLDYVARNIRYNPEPFGGIQVIFTGDYAQLPPVKADDKFAFESEFWKKSNIQVCYMPDIIRQTDLAFQKALNEIRLFNISKETKELLETRDITSPSYKNTSQIDNLIKPTKLYGTNNKVDKTNHKKLTELIEKNGTEYEYDLDIKIINKKIDPQKYIKSIRAPKKLILTEECQVMLIFNLDTEGGLVNGSRGVILKFIEDFPLVKFLNGKEVLISYNTWKIEEQGETIMEYSQIPLILGYGYTIHKCQGLTVDYAQINMEDFFENGQAYVAISRVRTLDGLIIKNLNWNRIKAHPKIIQFYKDL